MTTGKKTSPGRKVPSQIWKAAGSITGRTAPRDPWRRAQESARMRYEEGKERDPSKLQANYRVGDGNPLNPPCLFTRIGKLNDASIQPNMLRHRIWNEFHSSEINVRIPNEPLVSFINETVLKNWFLLMDKTQKGTHHADRPTSLR
jgi:hypothetical protein